MVKSGSYSERGSCPLMNKRICWNFEEFIQDMRFVYGSAACLVPLPCFIYVVRSVIRAIIIQTLNSNEGLKKISMVKYRCYVTFRSLPVSEVAGGVGFSSYMKTSTQPNHKFKPKHACKTHRKSCDSNHKFCGFETNWLKETIRSN